MDSGDKYLRGSNMLDIFEDMESIRSGLQDEFDIKIEEERYLTDSDKIIKGGRQKYCIKNGSSQINSKIYIFNANAEFEDILEDNQDKLSYESHINIPENREPTGDTRVLYFVPEMVTQDLIDYDKEKLELIDRFNEKLEFSAMSDRMESFGGRYLHFFNLEN